MMHFMRLHSAPFEKIKSGDKTIELRLYDEKRRAISVGDTVVFSDKSGQCLSARVKALHLFESFEKLYNVLPLLKCGYTAEDVGTAHHSDMLAYYSEEEQRKYGVVGIELSALCFKNAVVADAKQVQELYKSVIGSEGCVWNELYPSADEINADLAAESLFVLEDDGKVIAALSVVPENELDGMGCWQFENASEVARVVVHTAYRGNNLAIFMVNETEKLLRADGCKAIHLSVAKCNNAAYKTYIKTGFSVVGEVELYGGDYYLMEKLI